MTNGGVRLQVALDLSDLKTAVDVGRAVVEGGADCLEAGTVLLAKEGIHAVRELRRDNPGVPVIADLKISDNGYAQAKVAFEAGASAVTVLGAATDSTLRAAATAARECSGQVMLDLVTGENLRSQLHRIHDAGISQVIIHQGLDVQRAEGRLLVDDERLNQVPLGINLAVAGGITVDHLEDVCRMAPTTIIVGQAITGSDNPRRATETFRKYMSQIVRKI